MKHADEMVLQLNKLERLRVCEGPPLSPSRMPRGKRRREMRARPNFLVTRSEVQKKR